MPPPTASGAALAPRGHHGIKHRASRLRRRYAADTVLGATAGRRQRRAPRTSTAELITALRATATATRPTANTALGAWPAPTTARAALRAAPRN